MRVIKRSTRTRPRVSLILVDWGVRESFHLLHYLKDQTVPREAFEVILIEYYGAVSQAASKFESEIDTWILLEMPTDCYYHKHLMYNVGAVLSSGEIMTVMDSDAMVRPTFVEAILKAFEHDPSIVYHMDEVRNVRRDLYPFNYPSFEDVLGHGCINNVGGRTRGVLDDIDPIHTRNSGACMCARRKDVIAIGGADEDLTYLGHICGPYEMAFRLMNSGRRLVWETEEYLYHTWHPGSDGVDNYLGPHDGRNLSTTALEALCSGRSRPLIENEAIRRLRTGHQISDTGTELADVLIDPSYLEAFDRAKLGGAAATVVSTEHQINGIETELRDVLIDPGYLEAFDRTKLGGPAPTVVTPIHSRPVFVSYLRHDIYRLHGMFYAVTQDSGPPDLASSQWRKDERLVTGHSFAEVRDAIDAFEPRLLEAVGTCNICAVGKRFAVIPHELGSVDFQARSQRENPGIVWLASLAEARQTASRMSPPTPRSAERQDAIETFDARFVEAVGTCNICAVGQRFAVVPHELGSIDFQVRSQREDPGIVWLASLAEARKTANRMSDTFDARFLEAVGTCNICAVGTRFAVIPHKLGTIDFQVRSQRENPGIVWLASLAEAREIASKMDLSARRTAYANRIWRALIRVGRILQGAAKTLRLRRNGPE